MGEAEFFGFGDALVGAEGGANFAAKANFAKYYVIVVEFAAGYGARDGETNGKIGSGIVDFETANDVNEDVFVGEF